MLTPEAVDIALSSGPFGDGDQLALDANTLLQGRRWTRGADALPHPVRNSYDMASRLGSRAELDAFNAPLGHSALSETIAADVESWAAPLPWLAGETCWTVTDWAHGGSEAVLTVMRDRLAESGYHRPILPCRDSSVNAVAEAFPQALRLLDDCLPGVSHATLPLVHLVAVVDTHINSWYIAQIPQTIGLGEGFLRQCSATELAESLLHECLHEKYSLIRDLRSILCAGQSDATGLGVRLPWSNSLGERRVFRIGRVLSTLHVYAHLAAFHARLTRDPSLRGQAIGRLSTALTRAQFFLEMLNAPELRELLTREGLAFVDWMRVFAVGYAEQAASLLQLNLEHYDVGRMREEFLEL